MNLHFWALALHLAGVVVWVGGMFFAYVCLRPAAVEVLEPPLRLTLWARVFDRFFPAVWVTIALILGSGFAMAWRFGSNLWPHHVLAMLGLGGLMMLVFFDVFFLRFPRLKRAVQEKNWPAGGAALGMIRQRVGLNLLLGAMTVAVATLGRGL